MVTLKKASTSMLLAEVNKRRKSLPKLRRQRTQLLTRLEKVQSRIEELGGDHSAGQRGPGRLRKPSGKRGPGRPPKKAGVKKTTRRKRAKNKISLADALAAVMTQKPMKIADIISAVKQKGYRSSSNQFRNIVTQRLVADKRFKRVGRGEYAAV